MRALQPNKIDFKKRIFENPEKKAKAKRRTAAVVPIVLLVLVLGAVIGWLYWRVNYEITPQLDSVKAYSQSSETEEQYNSATQLTYELDAAMSELNNVEAASAAIDSYPELTKAACDAIDAAAGSSVTVVSMSYERATGIVTLGCLSNEMSYIPPFITALKASDTFKGGTVYYGEAAVVEEPEETPLPEETAEETVDETNDETGDTVDETVAAEPSGADFTYYYEFEVYCVLAKAEEAAEE